MAEIHLVERLQNLTCVDLAKSEWESGFWVVADDVARRLVGARLYLHSGQLESSHFGGEILSYRVQDTGEHAGRVIFRFRSNAGCKGVRTGKKGWGNEKKIVW